MNYGQYISIDPEILRGKPCIAGHRISVEMILEMLGLGDTIDDILNVYLSSAHTGTDSCCDHVCP